MLYCSCRTKVLVFITTYWEDKRLERDFEETMENIVNMLEEKEEARLKKLYEEWLKKRGEKKDEPQQQSSGGGMGFGGAMGGMGGLGGLKNTF